MSNSHPPIVTSQAVTFPAVVRSKIGGTSGPVVPVKSRGTDSYCKPSTQTEAYSTRTMTNSIQQNPLTINNPPLVPTKGSTAPVAPLSLNIHDLAQLLAASKNDHLPVWKLSQYNGDPLRWHKRFGQVESAESVSRIASKATPSLYLVGKHQRTGRKSPLITNFAFLASTGSTFFAGAKTTQVHRRRFFKLTQRLVTRNPESIPT